MTVSKLDTNKLKGWHVPDQKQFINQVFALMPFIVYIYDVQNQKNVFSNHSILEILGYNPLEIQSMQDIYPSLIHPEDYAVVKKHMSTVKMDKEVYELEYRMKHKCGQYIWLLSRESVFERDNEGRVKLIIGAAHNINKRKLAEQALEKSQNQLLQAYSVAKLGRWSYKIDQDVLTLGVDMALMLHIPTQSEYAINLSDFIFDYVHPDDQRAILQKMNDIKKYRDNHLESSFMFKGKVGEKTTFFQIHLIKKADQHVIGLCQDVSEQQNYEHRILESNKMLKKINAELDQFVYRSSHNLRSPLVSILGLIDIIINTDSRDETRKMLLMVESRVKALDETIHEINDYYHNARNEVTPENLNLNEVIDDVLHQLSFQANFETIQVIKHLEINNLYIDKLRLKSILINILSNCYKYSDSLKTRKVIKLRSRIRQHHLVLTIADNGIGIQAEYMYRVFEMFFKAQNRSQGTGLGLFIARETVHQLKGEIHIDSKYEKGTFVTIKLPLRS